MSDEQFLDDSLIERVDKFGEALRDRLQSEGGLSKWGAEFKVEKPRGSDYWRSKVGVGEDTIKKNWLQLNGNTYFHPSYCSPKRWKIQARFGCAPDSPLWERKTPYIRNRKPQEWSIGGSDVWAVSYEHLEALLAKEQTSSVMEEIVEDLKVSWAYSNNRPPDPSTPKNDAQSNGRIEVTLYINPTIWSRFQEICEKEYRPRRKNSKLPSYAKLRDRAINTALMDYITKNEGTKSES